MRWRNEARFRTEPSMGLTGLAALDVSCDIGAEGRGRTWSMLLLNLLTRSLNEACRDLAVGIWADRSLVDRGPMLLNVSEAERYCPD